MHDAGTSPPTTLDAPAPHDEVPAARSAVSSPVEGKGHETCPTCRRPQASDGGDLARRASSVGLTPRETQVLRLVGQTVSNDEIARILGVSINSVKSYIRSAYRRIGVESRPAAVLWANGFDIEQLARTRSSGASRTTGATSGGSAARVG